MRYINKTSRIFLYINLSKIMIKGINQSMVNRSIAGGVNCKCIGGGSNGSGVNGGKITVEIPLYRVEETSGDPPTTTTNIYVKKEDADKVFKEILNIDQEKYFFYRYSMQHLEVGIDGFINITSFPCTNIYNRYRLVLSTQLIDIRNAINTDEIIIMLNLTNEAIDYEYSKIMNSNYIVDTFPDTPGRSNSIKLTLYYMER